jgi:predicted dehydrogenase
MAELRVGVVGAGYWGINHVRAWSRLAGAQLVAVCDSDPAALARAAALAPSARSHASFDALLDDDVEAVVLATPAIAHAEQTRRALVAGRHVLVEKPIALDPAEASSVAADAERAGRVLMVGHLMLYHPGFRRLVDIVASGELGELLYAYSLRVNLGRLRRDENALWSLGPHDVSMLLEIFGDLPESISARGAAYLQDGIEDVVFVNLSFPGQRMAQIQLSWLDPRKERRLTVVGSRKMVEFDDVHPTEKLRIYDKGYERPPSFTQYGEYLTVRHGDVHIPRIDMAEPLELECRHFVDCCRGAGPPRSGPRHAVQVVQILDAAQHSLERGGTPVKL